MRQNISRAINKNSWQALAKSWNKLDVPWRPTPYTIATVKKHIRALSKHKGSRALVMGSTVEFRDVLADFKIATTCLEISPLLYKALGSLCKKKHRRERLVVGNWLDVPFAPHTFDIVLGDYLTSNVRFNEWETLFKNIAAYLKPRGKAVLAIATVPPLTKRDPSALSTMVNAYVENPKQFAHFTDKWLWIVETARVTEGCYDKRNYTFAWHAFDALLEQELKKHNLGTGHLDSLKAGVGVNFDPFVPLQIIDAKLRASFAIIQKGTEMRRHPIMRYFYTYVVKPTREGTIEK